MIGVLVLGAVIAALLAVACWCGRGETSGKAGDSVNSRYDGSDGGGF